MVPYSPLLHRRMFEYLSETYCDCFSRKNGFGLLVALDSDNGLARGELFWDDGDTIGR